MVRKCSKCQKEIISGKFYNFYTGKKGGKNLSAYKGRELFCPSCAEKEKMNDIVYLDNLIKVEWEVGNQVDEEVLEFEEKWKNFQYENSVRINNEETNLTLDFIQKSKQEFEPYLQKLSIVEKSFGGKIEGCGKGQMSFDYLFVKSALNENYRKGVVGPTIAKILGGNPSQEINTTNIGTSPGVPGRTSGTWQVNNELNISYVWNDGPERICRRISFIFYDQKFALRALCRVLTIKEKELKGEIPEPNQPDNNEKDSPPPPSQPGNQNDNNKTENSPPNKSNYVLWISLSAGAILLAGLIIWLFYKKKKKTNYLE